MFALAHVKKDDMRFLARLWTPSAQKILAEMLEELRDLQRSPRHINGLFYDLRHFVVAYPRIERWKAAKIRAYLRERKVGPRRADNIRDSIVTLSRFARRYGYLPEGVISEAEKVRKIKKGCDVLIWSPAETRLILEHVSAKWLPAIAIGFFAGLRKSEILRLDWSAFKFDQDPPEIAVSAKIAQKIRRSRLVPILPNLMSWLEPYRARVGPLYPGNFKTNENALSLEIKRIRKRTGLPRRDNALRHSFGTYRLALTRNCARVAEEMGNSPRKVRENYNDPRPESEAQSFFAISRPSIENILPLELEFVG
jgi:integrase